MPGFIFSPWACLAGIVTRGIEPAWSGLAWCCGLFAEKGALSPDCLLLWTVEITFSSNLSTAAGTSCLLHLHPWPVPAVAGTKSACTWLPCSDSSSSTSDLSFPRPLTLHLSGFQLYFSIPWFPACTLEPAPPILFSPLDFLDSHRLCPCPHPHGD